MWRNFEKKLFFNTIIKIESGISKNKNFFYCTPFLLACRNSDPSIVEYILDNIKDVDINAISLISMIFFFDGGIFF